MKRKYRLVARRSSSHRKCWYCGKSFHSTRPTFDHQIPRSRGGGGGENLVLACKQCNNRKADMDVETYRYFLQESLPAGERVIFYGEQQNQSSTA